MIPAIGYWEAQPWRAVSGAILLDIRLTPKSSADRVDGMRTLSGGRTVLTVRVRAVPDKGKANTAMIKLIAAWLDLPASAIVITSGKTARLKTVRIGGDPVRLAETLQGRMNGGAA